MQLVSVSGNTTKPVSARVQIQIPGGTQDSLNFVAATTNLFGQVPIGQTELKVLLTDSAGNELTTNAKTGSASQFVFVGASSSNSLGLASDARRYDDVFSRSEIDG